LRYERYEFLVDRYSDANINEKLLLKVAFKNFFSGIFFGNLKIFLVS
jgi:hypothetical protein